MDLTQTRESPFACARVDELMPVFTYFLAHSQARSTDLKSAFGCLSVCKSWYNIVQSPCLWASVRVSNYGDDGSDEVGKHVSLNCDSLAAMASFMQHSHRLDFFFSRWSDELLSCILSLALQSGNNLHALNLQSIRLLKLPQSAVALGDGCPELNEFSLERSRCMDTTELPILEGLFTKWKSLEKLSLRFVPFAETTVALLPNLLDLSLTMNPQLCSPEAVQALGTCTKLQNFTFVAAPRISSYLHVFGDALAVVLQSCLKLRGLTLGKICIGLNLFMEICRSIQSRLQNLKLDNCKWTDVSSTSLAGLGALRSFEANNCLHMRDEELHALSMASQRKLRRLAVRNVHGSDITDNGLLAVAKAYEDLEDLCITGDTSGCNGVTDHFLEQLMTHGTLNGLTKLNMRGFYELTSDAVNRFRLARPGLVCHWAELQSP